ncbi:hypothetical protein LguiA_026513 [Lonicera macranthoides]
MRTRKSEKKRLKIKEGGTLMNKKLTELVMAKHFKLEKVGEESSNLWRGVALGAAPQHKIQRYVLSLLPSLPSLYSSANWATIDTLKIEKTSFMSGAISLTRRTRIISLIIDLLCGVSGQTDMSRSFPYFHGCSGYHISLIFKDELEDDTSGKTFPDRLFLALMKAGFHTFQDDQEIEREDARKQIVQRSNCCIIFFSKGYASCKRRLDEVVKFLDCYRACPHRIVPVYDYDVEQSDVRNQLGSFGEAFAVYEKEIEDETDNGKKGKLRDDVRRRRGALRGVAKLPGFNLRNAANGSGSEEVIKKIASVMEDKVCREFAKGRQPLVGLHSRAERINLWVQRTNSNEDLLL